MLSLSLFSSSVNADTIPLIPVDHSGWSIKDWVQLFIAQCTAQGIDFVGKVEDAVYTAFGLYNLDISSFEDAEIYINKNNNTISFDPLTVEQFNNITEYIYDTYYPESTEKKYILGTETNDYFDSNGAHIYLSTYSGYDISQLGTLYQHPISVASIGTWDNPQSFPVCTFNNQAYYFYYYVTNGTLYRYVGTTAPTSSGQYTNAYANPSSVNIFFTRSDPYIYLSHTFKPIDYPDIRAYVSSVNMGTTGISQEELTSYIEFLDSFPKKYPDITLPDSDVIDTSKRNAVQLPTDLVNTLDQNYGDAWTLADYIALLNDALTLDLQGIKELVKEQTMVIVDAITGDIDVPIVNDFDYVIPSDIAIPLINPELPDLPSGIALTDLIPTGNGLFNEIKYDMEQTFDMMISQDSQILIYAPFIILIVGLFLR